MAGRGGGRGRRPTTASCSTTTRRPGPDPRSRRQPEGVHGLSRRFDPDAYAWRDTAWTGRRSPAGPSTSCTSAPSRPRALSTGDRPAGPSGRPGRDLLELMPVAGFTARGWGYDGVICIRPSRRTAGLLPTAPRRCLSLAWPRRNPGRGLQPLRPLRQLLTEFFPILAEGGANTWGNSINLSRPDSDEVRRYVLDNAPMWLRDITSTGCGSTPSTPWSTSGPPTCSRRWPRRSTSSRSPSAGR